MRPNFCGKIIVIFSALSALTGLVGGTGWNSLLYAGDEELLGVEEEVQAEEFQEENRRKMQEVFLGPEDYAVSGSKHAQKLSESPSTITVLDREDIRSYGMTSLAELLRIVPGVNLKEITPSYQVLGIRGFHSNIGNGVLYLVDGQEINNNLFGGIVWSLLPVSLDDIERIEVIRGPGSGLYGANAFSGVVNITTREPRTLKTATLVAETGFFGGDLGTQLYKAKLARELTPVSFLVSGDFDRRQSWMDPDQNMSQVYRGRFQAVYEPAGDTRLSLDGSYLRGKQEYFINLGKMDFHSNEVASAGATLKWRDFKFIGYFRRFDLEADIISPVAIIQSLFDKITCRMDNLEGRLEYAHRFPFHNRLTGGAGFLLNAFESPLLVREYNDEKRAGIFLQDEWTPWEELLLTVGLRYDYNSTNDDSLSPRASAVYFFSRDQNLRFAFGEAFRKPSFFEYGMQLKTLEEAGPLLSEMLYNPDLKNSKVRTFELGYRGYFLRRVRADLTLYWSQYRNTIISSIRTGRFENYEDYADGLGGELALEAYLHPRLDGFFNYSYLNTVYQMGPEAAPFPLIDDFYAEHTLNLGLRGRPVDGLRLGAVLNFVGPSHESIMDPNLSDFLPRETGPRELGPYWLFSLRGGYEVIREQVEVGIKVFNLLGTEARQYPGVIWEKEEPENWGAEKVGRTITLYLEAAF